MSGNKPEYYVLSLSGGKDSTALGLEWLKRHKEDPVAYPFHEVLHCDTGMDFPAMERHINRLEKIFTASGIKFTRIRTEKSFEFYMFEYSPKRKNPNLKDKKGFSWPGPLSRWCTAELKIRPINRYLKGLLKQYKVIQLIGLAFDETVRLDRKNNKNGTHRHPLAEWEWTESQCLQYCYRSGFDWEGLYEIFDRVSCWCCPLQSIDDLRMLRKHFPDLWAKLLGMDRRTWRSFRADYSVDELDIRFQFEEECLAIGIPVNRGRYFREGLKRRIKYEMKRRGEHITTEQKQHVGCVQALVRRLFKRR